MTEEELSRAMREHAAMMNAAHKPSLETRLDWLKAEASAQRTAIWKLERGNRWHQMVLWVLVFYVVTLPLVWMLNFPPPSVMP